MNNATQLIQAPVIQGTTLRRRRITLLIDPSGGTWTRVLVPISPDTVNRLVDLHEKGELDVRVEPLPAEEFRAREMAWIQEHRDGLADRHGGEWIALEGDQIVAHANDLVRVLELARDAGHSHPFVTMIPAGPNIPFYGCRS